MTRPDSEPAPDLAGLGSIAPEPGRSIRARVGAVATSYRKKAKRNGDGASDAPPPALPRKTRAEPSTSGPAKHVAAAPSARATRGNAGFKLVSPYQPGGDQPR